MYLIILAIFGIVIFFASSSIFNIISIIQTKTSYINNIGINWFISILLINIILLIFIIVFYYIKVKSSGRAGISGQQGLKGNNADIVKCKYSNNISNSYSC